MRARDPELPRERPAAPLAAVELVRRFGKGAAAIPAVAGLSLEVRPGELYGLVGPDGAGKTTAIRLLVGLLAPDAGEARVLGVSVHGAPLSVREGLGYMPQRYSLYGDLSVEENLVFFARLFGLGGAERAERMARLLELTRLAPFRDRRADALSGGMYKKLALACALLHRPRVLCLDEPTNGVDPVSRRELWDLLYEFVADGMAVLLATPYMDEAARCHRVGLMHRGRLLVEGEPGTLTREFVHTTWRLDGGDRDRVEAALAARPEVLALSPQGASIRVVVRRDGAGAFERWARGEAALTLARVEPDFEDVFLGLLADPAGTAGGGAGGGGAPRA